MKEALSLFIQFVKIGCFTFGGGWSIVAQIQKIYVEEQKCITDEELLDLTSVGRSIPGIMIANISMLFGYRQAGVLGGIACVLGLSLPPMVILSIVTLFYTAFRSNPWVVSAMTGIRIAVVPIILSATVTMMKSVFKKKTGIILAIIAFFAYLVFDFGTVTLVFCGAVCGILLNWNKKENMEVGEKQ